MLSHVLLNHPPPLLSQKFLPGPHFVSPKPLHPPSFSYSYPTSLSPVQSASPATVEDDISSPPSPHSASGNYHYASRSTGSFDSPISPTEMYNPNSQPHSYSTSQQSYPPESSSSQPNYPFINDDLPLRPSQFDRPHLSETPSPVDHRPSSSYPLDIGATHSQDRPLSQISPSLPHDRYDPPPDIEAEHHSQNISSARYTESTNSHLQNVSIDQSSMSEPVILAPLIPYSDLQSSHRIQSQSNYTPSSLTIPRSPARGHSLQRGATMGSLRDLRHSHLDYPAHTQPYPHWKDDSLRSHQLGSYQGNTGFDAPISPLQANFSSESVGPRGAAVQYPPTGESIYGASPPVASTSSLGLVAESYAQKDDITTRDNSNKTYSFVVGGNTGKKRPRRRYDEIERLYRCSHPGCNKAYGTLNHLNAHVTMQKHGDKRQPSEFKELRKQWRKAKKPASPGPMRRHSMSLRHDTRDYDTHRYESRSESSASLSTRQPAYHTSAGLPSSTPSILSEPGDRLSFSVIDEREEHSDIYSTHERQRFSSSAPWPGYTRSQQYLPSSLPNQPPGFVQGDTSFPLDTRGTQSQRSRSQSSLEPSMGRLPPDSTLFTPLSGYQPSLLPPLQEGEHRDVPYSAGADYETFDNGRDGRPHTGHRSLGDNEENY